MKKLLLIAFIASFAFTAKAQIKLGAGLDIGDPLGVVVKAQKGITDVIDADVMLTYYLTESVEFYSSSIVTLDLNGHYNFEVGDGFKVYPLAGIGVSFVTAKSTVPGFEFNNSSTNIGLNIGGGASYDLGSMEIWAEFIATLSDGTGSGLKAGLLFPLGG